MRTLLSANEGGTLLLGILRLAHDYVEAQRLRAERVQIAHMQAQLDDMRRQLDALTRGRGEKQASPVDQDPVA